MPTDSGSTSKEWCSAWTIPTNPCRTLEERAITEDDLVTLMKRISTNPEVPEGPWCKDFGSFKLVGHGSRPGTLLDKDQSCFGMRI